MFSASFFECSTCGAAGAEPSIGAACVARAWVEAAFSIADTCGAALDPGALAGPFAAAGGLGFLAAVAAPLVGRAVFARAGLVSAGADFGRGLAPGCVDLEDFDAGLAVASFAADGGAAGAFLAETASVSVDFAALRRGVSTLSTAVFFAVTRFLTPALEVFGLPLPTESLAIVQIPH